MTPMIFILVAHTRKSNEHLQMLTIVSHVVIFAKFSRTCAEKADFWNSYYNPDANIIGNLIMGKTGKRNKADWRLWSLRWEWCQKRNTSERLDNPPSNIKAISSRLLWGLEDRLQVTLFFKYSKTNLTPNGIQGTCVPYRAGKCKEIYKCQKQAYTVMHKYLENKQGYANKHKQHRHESLSLSFSSKYEMMHDL